MVSSKEGETSVPLAVEDERITTKLNMIMQMAIMVKYRTGELVSDLQLRDADASIRDNMVEVLLDMNSRGNVSYMGILECRLLDADGRQMNQRRTNLAVYRKLLRRVDLALTEGDFRPPYKVEVVISPDGRTDVPPEDMIKGNRIAQTLAVR